MSYYKIRSHDGTVLGIASAPGLRKWQTKYSRVIAARNQDEASMIACDYPEGNELYRDTWMIQHPEADRHSVLAEVIEITREQYNELSDELSAGDVHEGIPEEAPEKPEEPTETIAAMTKTDMLEMLADLELRISMLELGVAMV